MKKVFFCLAFIACGLHFTVAQKAGVPEKWKNESVVILEQKLTFNYLFETNLHRAILGKNEPELPNNCIETVNRKLKLQDKAAVSAFSEFYFYESEQDQATREKAAKKGKKEESVIEITVIKPSGKELKVDVSAGILTDADNVPKFLRCAAFSFAYIRGRYKKIAIPNLEVGDVLAYQSSVEYQQSMTVKLFAWYAAFPPYHATLAAQYPIVKQELNFILHPKFYVNANTYNGAPKFKIIPKGEDRKGKVNEKKVTYQLTSENIERVPNEMMSFAKTYLPTVKLQVVDKFRETTPTEGNLFTDEKYEVKQVVTPNDVARQFNADFRKTYNNVKNKFSDFVERYNLTKKPFEQQVKMAYAFIKTNRDYNDKSKYNNYAIGGLYRMNWKPQRSTKESYFMKYTNAANMGKDFEFAAAMSRCLDMLQIPHEVLAVMPRDIGKLSDLLLGAEVTWEHEINKSVFCQSRRD